MGNTSIRSSSTYNCVLLIGRPIDTGPVSTSATQQPPPVSVGQYSLKSRTAPASSPHRSPTRGGSDQPVRPSTAVAALPNATASTSPVSKSRHFAVLPPTPQRRP